jgi:peroxiredoxin
LRAYQQILPEIEVLGATLVAVSPQTSDNTLSTAEKNELKFPVLSDVGNKVAQQFGLVFTVPEHLWPIYKRLGNDLPAYNGDESWELPMPGTFVVARDGTIRLAFVDADFTRRLDPAEILRSLRELSGEEGG